MGENNTKIIKTPAGHEVVLKTEMTAREYRELKNMWIKDVVITGSDPDSPKISGIRGSVVQEVENRALQIMIISIDGKSENCLEALLDFPVEDFDMVFDEVNKLTEHLAQKKTN